MGESKTKKNRGININASPAEHVVSGSPLERGSGAKPNPRRAFYICKHWKGDRILVFCRPSGARRYAHSLPGVPLRSTPGCYLPALPRLDKLVFVGLMNLLLTAEGCFYSGSWLLTPDSCFISSSILFSSLCISIGLIS